MAAAEAGFAERIAEDVHRMQEDPCPAAGWRMVADAFLDYLGARSVRLPELSARDAEVAFGSAAAAAVGALELTAFPGRRFGVFIDYVGAGVSYGGGFTRGDERSEQDGKTGASDWLAALWPAFLARIADDRAEVFIEAAPPWRGNEGRADVALVHALMAYVFGHEEGPDGFCPGPVQDLEKCALIDMVVSTLGEGDDWPAHRAALRTLRALAAGDEKAFGQGLAEQLEQHRERAAVRGAGARSLLPLDAMALTAMALRWQRWDVPVESGYLPRGPVTGFEPGAPRVRAYGRDKRANAMAVLSAGPLTVDRPHQPGAAGPTDVSWYEEFAAQETARFHDPAEDPKTLARDLTSLMADQRGLLLAHLALDRHRMDLHQKDPHRKDLHRADPHANTPRPNAPRPNTPHPKDSRPYEAALLGAEAGAGALRVARAEPGTEVEVTIGGTSRTLPAWRSPYRPNPSQWQQAVALALIAGARGPLADCVLVAPEFFAEGDHPSPGGAYCAALHDYLRGVDPVPAMDHALVTADRTPRPSFLRPPIVLLSQLVEGDRPGFALAVADALEEHRAHYTVGSRGTGPEAAVNLDVLGLVCHARRLGWAVPVRSPYLPDDLLG
ncbi:immunity 49 family protein [Streptomyces sp. NPDC048111]|uniref:immunity 49 family protein n=1 Tax=Streptomyces sp. NPDC048111 TaxID=3365500 RepID=UPI00372129EC